MMNKTCNRKRGRPRKEVIPKISKHMDIITNQLTHAVSSGEVVWGKLGSSRWWPAVTIAGSDCGRHLAHEHMVWVFWYGDHKISQLPRDKVVNFVLEFGNKFSSYDGKLYVNGVLEALKEIAHRSNAPVAKGDSLALIQWGKSAFIKEPKVLHYKATGFAPENIQCYLEKMRCQYLEKHEPQRAEEDAIKKVLQGTLKLEEICIVCDTVPAVIDAQHPLVDGGLCHDCKETVLESMFAYGDDGANQLQVYCAICGEGGQLLICDNTACNRCLCTGCIRSLAGPQESAKVLESNPWCCYLCSERNVGLLRCKKDWQLNVMKLFQPLNSIAAAPPLDDYRDKQPIRVLSLFDGIATGKLVLDQVGLVVDKYFSSEIDQDAIHVSTLQHGLGVTQLGPVEILTEDEISKLCPIHLLIGGSPCNDLSLVNPARKGLYDACGSGKLFFDFYRVLKALQLGNKGHHLFWMYENVASMPGEYKRIITRFLQCEPVLLDGKFFSPQVRARYFWGNIPGMYSPLPSHLLEKEISLSSVLYCTLGREAVVDKIQTVTTRGNSLRQGKNCILPVLYKGQGDVLWITELERNSYLFKVLELR
ncbi:DNA (cytosine-5)-methyltransferase 3B-like [Ornithodoros turicata]|uniref:DNA (cytosine-5)-methyltransferase 3B-like n=1 Tax=Ornithodoros turicata TaxID=34597 RepID=UPI003139F5F8